MQALRINSAKAGSALPLGRVMLAGAALVAIDAGVSYHAARPRSPRTRRASRSRCAARPASPQEVAAARDTVQRLSLPWDDLFSAIESAASDKVALAAIEPTRATAR